MPEAMNEIYNILIDLKLNWAKKLAQQSNSFENFVNKAHTSARKLEKSITGMQTAVAQSYKGVFKGSQKEIDSLTKFAESSIKGISASATKIMQEAEKRQTQHVKFVEKNIKRLYDAEKKLGIAKGQLKTYTDKGVKTGVDFTKAKERVEKFQDYITGVNKGMAKVAQNHVRQLSWWVGEHFKSVSKGVLAKSKAVSKATDLLIKDTISKFKMLKSQTGLMGKVGGTVQVAKGIGQMEAQQKAVYTNLKQMAEAHATAQMAYQEQIKLRNQQVSKARITLQKNESVKNLQILKEMIRHHDDLVSQTKKNLDKVKTEYLETAQSAKKLTTEIRKQKAEMGKKVTGLYQGMQKELAPSKIKALFTPMFANLRETAAFAGKGMMKELMASAAKGDVLRDKLKQFKDRLVEIKQQAAMLSKQGLIDPDKIGPKIAKAEGMVKKFSDTIKRMQSDMARFAPKRMKEFRVFELGDVSKTRQQIKSLGQDLRRTTQITSENFEDMHKDFKKINDLMQQHIKQRRSAAKKIENIEKESKRVQLLIAQTGDAAMRKQMSAYVARLNTHAKNLRKVLERPMTFPKGKIEQFQNKFVGVVKQTVGRVNAIVRNIDLVPASAFQELKQQYNSTIALIEKASKKRFFRTESINTAKIEVGSLTKEVRKYTGTIDRLQKELKELEMMQRRGFRNEGVRRATVELKKHISGLKSYVSQINSMHSHAVKRMRDTARVSTKSMLRSGWEMVRNFRWQVAAIIYLISRAVQAVKRVFLGVMDEIAKFRRDSMSLAAQYSFKMFGDMKKTFKEAYEFSRNLMQKLEVVAAETILTMDDMLMLTKTFAQAGVIPRTDEDLRRIATIGTAIKALTEGMANAGVQMKQELYAIIAGRQRATDQLAMMFKLMGTDIQKLIDEEKRGGVEMIQALADALRPFSVMNEALKDEWEAVINKMKIVWKIIKRLALEESLLQSAKAFKAFVETFWTKVDGLTAKGRMAAAVMRGGFEVVRAIVVGIWESFLMILHTMAAIVNVGMSFVGITSQIDANANAAGQSMKGFLTAMEGLLKVTWLIKHTIVAILTVIEAIIAPINYIVEAFKAMGAYAGYAALKISAMFTISKDLKRAMNEAAEGQRKLGEATIGAAYKRLSDAGAGLMNLVKNANKEYKEVEDTIDAILKKLEDVGKVNKKLGQEFKLTYPTGIFDEWAKMFGEMQRAEAAQFKGPKRWQIETRQKIEALDTLKYKTNKNLKDLAGMQEAYDKGILKMTEEQFKKFNKSYAAHREVIGSVYKYELFLKNELGRKTAEWNRKEEIRMAKQQRKYQQFMREVLQTPMTPKEKAADWLEKMKIDVKELAISNEFFAKNIDKVNEALEKGLDIREATAFKEMNLEAEKFINKASKAGAWNNVFDKLNIEFAEYIRQMEKSTKLDAAKKEELRKQLGLIKDQRIAQEQLNLIHEAYIKQLDVQTKKAQYLKGSFSPIKQRQGEIMALQATHNAEMARMRKQLDEYNLRWKENGEWVEKADASVRSIGDSMEETMKQMTLATQRELQKKQMPIWNDLTEASKGWADGFTDALSEIVVSLDSVGEAMQALQQQIIKDVAKTLIKRTITDNLMDTLGTGFMGEETPFQKWFGGGKKEGKGKGAQEITATKPIPVRIVGATQGLLDASVKPLEKMEKLSLPEEGIAGQKVFVTNWPIGGAGMIGGTGEIVTEGVKGVTQELADTSAVIAENTAAAEQSTKSWYSGITDVFSSIGSWLSGLFGGGGAGAGAGGGGMDWAGMAMQAGSMMMAEGGRITEPIVGKGLKSGEIYNFGEKTKYGEDEIVAPMTKIQKSVPQNKFEYHMPIHLSSIDTQSGVQFLMKHSDTIQSHMIKSLKKNKPIRKGIQNAY